VSRSKIHIFVEGRETDPYVYSRLCEDELSPLGLEFKVTRADELDPIPGSGGKVRLLGFFDYLKSTGSLCGEFKGETYATLFMLDKDIDDVLSKRRRSRHIVYTETYDIENYLFLEGDLPTAVAIALGIDRTLVSGWLPSSTGWCNATSTNWIHWTSVCLMCKRAQIPGIGNYSAPNTVNIPLHGTCDASEIENVMIRITIASGLSRTEIDDQFRRAKDLVTRRCRSGRPDTVFKGKWYPNVIASAAESHHPTEYRHCKSFRQSVLSVLQATLNWSGNWSAHIRNALVDVASLV
jgi:hypothetical protein